MERQRWLNVFTAAKEQLTAEQRFPLLTECLRMGGSVAMFPMLKDWNRPKLDALLAEIDAADDVANAAYRVFKPHFFLHKSGQRQLDAARMEATAILSEVAAVALYFIGQTGQEGSHE
jgi:hypothetical protein